MGKTDILCVHTIAFPCSNSFGEWNITAPRMKVLLAACSFMARAGTVGQERFRMETVLTVRRQDYDSSMVMVKLPCIAYR